MLALGLPKHSTPRARKEFERSPKELRKADRGEGCDSAARSPSEPPDRVDRRRKLGPGGLVVVGASVGGPIPPDLRTDLKARVGLPGDPQGQIVEARGKTR